jgi:hypothetical protein
VEFGSQTSKLSMNGVFGIMDLENDRPMGLMANIATDGLQLTTWKPIEPKSIFSFRLRLPEPICGSPFIVLDAECVWCKQANDQRSYLVGFKIYSITPSNSKRVKGLLESLGKTETASST